MVEEAQGEGQGGQGEEDPVVELNLEIKIPAYLFLLLLPTRRSGFQSVKFGPNAATPSANDVARPNQLQYRAIHQNSKLPPRASRKFVISSRVRPPTHNASGGKKMHPPEPALTFTLPSIHDGTVLDSRVYHPPSFSSSSTWRPRHAAVVGHPYAPLGGCYDDPIVGDVTSLLLRRGLIVGTFNFRYGYRRNAQTTM